MCCEYGAANNAVYEMIQAARRKDPGFDIKLLRGIVDFNLKHKTAVENIRYCKICGEPASGEVCAVCKLRAKLSTSSLLKSPGLS